MVDIKKVFVKYFYFIWLLVLVFALLGMSSKVISVGLFELIFVFFIAGYIVYGYWMKKKMYG
jgi:hypothetical protein